MTPAAPHDPDHNRPRTPKEKAMSKQIEPTDAMIDKAAHVLCLNATGMSLRFQDDMEKRAYRNRVRPALCAALNHPDAPGLFTDEDDRPWEPLNGGRVYVGDEVRHERSGITTTAVVAHVDEDGDLWTAEGAFIGPLDVGTWHVRRAAQELPAKDGAQIIPTHGAIEAVWNGVIYTTDRATYDGMGRVWVGVWRGENDHSTYEMHPENINPITWREAKK